MSMVEFFFGFSSFVFKKKRIFANGKKNMSNMDLLVTEHVEKTYSKHKALDDINIAVPEGSVLGLLGPNGAGKTTLIRIINQITAPDKGNVYFCGERLSRGHISQIGYLPEERGLYKKMAVGEQAMYLARLKGISKNDARKRLTEWFERFEISDWWNRKVEELSKGMQQKVQFIVTVLHEPKLLIFDEPFSGFDPINANILKEEIIRLKNNGATVIFSTHNMASVEELCNEIVLINKSKVVLSGKVNDIRKSYRKNLFKIQCSGNTDNLNFGNGIEIVEKEIADETLLKIRLAGDVKPNDLIQQLINQVNVVSFQEILPDMNEIFIEAVKNTSN